MLALSIHVPFRRTKESISYLYTVASVKKETPFYHLLVFAEYLLFQALCCCYLQLVAAVGIAEELLAFGLVPVAWRCWNHPCRRLLLLLLVEVVEIVFYLLRRLLQLVVVLARHGVQLSTAWVSWGG